MKITVEHYDEKISIEVGNDDVTFEEFMQLVEKVAHGIGYHTSAINEWFNEDS